LVIDAELWGKAINLRIYAMADEPSSKLGHAFSMGKSAFGRQTPIDF